MLFIFPFFPSCLLDSLFCPIKCCRPYLRFPQRDLFLLSPVFASPAFWHRNNDVIGLGWSRTHCLVAQLGQDTISLRCLLLGRLIISDDFCMERKGYRVITPFCCWLSREKKKNLVLFSNVIISEQARSIQCFI